MSVIIKKIVLNTSNDQKLTF